MKTRIIRLGTDVTRSGAENDRTVVGWEPEDVAPPAFPEAFATAFATAFPALREACAELELPGIAVAAVRGARVAGRLALTATPHRLTTAIVGRHGAADLYLPGDGALALRQLALIVHPLDGAEPQRVRFRALDLRTSAGFSDEAGRPLRALESDGPVFLRVASTVLLVVPTRLAAGWGSSAGDAWAALPERSFQGEGPAPRGGEGPAPPGGEGPASKGGAGPRPFRPVVEVLRPEGTPMIEHPAPRARGTIVTSVPGPSLARRSLLGEGEAAIGCLRLRAGARVAELVVGERAAREGVILGRYDRCDTVDLPVFQDRSLSRVHALLIRVGASPSPHLIDTASSNGTFEGSGGERARAIVLAPGVEARLAGDAVRIEWEPAGGAGGAARGRGPGPGPGRLPC